MTRDRWWAAAEVLVIVLLVLSWSEDGRHVLLLPEGWESHGNAAERKEDGIVSLDMDVVDRELQKCAAIFG